MMLKRKALIAFAFVLLLASLAGGQTIPKPEFSATDDSTPLGLEPGAPAGAFPLSGFDHVNLYNGHLSFTLPLLAIGGRGEARYPMSQVISSPPWRVETFVVPFENCSEPGVCFWEYGFDAVPASHWWHKVEAGYGPGVVMGRRAADNFDAACSQFQNAFTHFVFVAPDGTETKLYDTLNVGITNNSCLFGPTGSLRGRYFASRDGSGMTFITDEEVHDLYDGLIYSSDTNISPQSGVLMMRDGRRYKIDSSGRVTSITDRNGNKISFQYRQVPGPPGSLDTYDVETITDSLNRTVTIEYAVADCGAPYGKCNRISYQGFGATSRKIHVSLVTLGSALRSDFAGQTGDLFPELPGLTDINNTHEVVSSVWLPDGRRYRFLYNRFGEPARVELPTGGAIEFDYAAGVIGALASGQLGGDFGTQRSSQPRPPYQIAIYRRVVERREHPNGGSGSTYARKTVYGKAETLTSATTGQASVSTQGWVLAEEYGSGGRLNSRRHHHWGWPFFSSPQVSTVYGPAFNMLNTLGLRGHDAPYEAKERLIETFASNGTTQLRTVNQNWELGTGAPHVTNVTEVATTLNDSGQVSKQTFGFDQFNNQTDVHDFRYGDLKRVRRTRATYFADAAYTAPEIHLRSLPEFRELYAVNPADDTETLVEKTQFSYDQTPRLNRSPITSHDSVNFGTGYALRGNVTTISRLLKGTPDTWIPEAREYDIAGNVVKAIDANLNPTDFIFDDDYGIGNQNTFAFPTRVLLSIAQAGDPRLEIQTAYDYHNGKPVRRVDANGGITTLDYTDPLDRLKEFTVGSGSAEQNRTTYVYDQPNATLTIESDLDPDRPKQKKHIIYDGFGRTAETRVYETDADAYIVTTQNYDALGRVRQASNPYRPGDTVRLTTTDYDALGRMDAVTSPDGSLVDSVYTGNETTIIDAAGRRRKTVTDALGRLEKVVEDPVGSPLETFYTYDAGDRLTDVVQGAQPRTFRYDSLGRLTQAINPESGELRYQYDSNGNLRESRHVGRNLVTTYAPYDGLNRPTQKSYSDNITPTITYCYDGRVGDPCTGSPTLPNKGRLTAVSARVPGQPSPFTSTRYVYTLLGRVASSTQTTDTRDYTFSYGYTLAGHLKSQGYPSGMAVTTSYDRVGRITSIASQRPGAPSPTNNISSASYAAHGAAAAMQLGNGLWERATYNCRLQPERIALGTGAGSGTADDWSVLRLDYRHGTAASSSCPTSFTNNNGNVAEQAITIPGRTLVQTYGYDALNRLGSVIEPAVPAVPGPSGGVGLPALAGWNQTYDYDRYGNRWVSSWSTNVPPHPVLTPTGSTWYDPLTNRIIGMNYDPAGNQTAANQVTYTYL